MLGKATHSSRLLSMVPLVLPLIVCVSCGGNDDGAGGGDGGAIDGGGGADGGGGDGGGGGNAGVLSIVTGQQHSCALLDGGMIKCWGEAEDAALGLGDAENRGDDPGEMGSALPAVNLGQGRRALQISSDDNDVCAVFDDGALKCWGENGGGALGLGDTIPRGLAPGDMGEALPAVDLGTGKKAVQVATAISSTCALLDDGTVRCWGCVPGNSPEDIGDEPGEMGDALVAVNLGSDSVQSIAHAGNSVCALLENGGVRCFGIGARGQLGQGDTLAVNIDQEAPLVDLGTGRTATAIAAGRQFHCALRDDGSVVCWGSNEYGKLGTGDTEDRGDEPGEMGDALVPVDFGDGMTARWVSAGWEHACAVVEDGTVRCWGRNDSGYLGVSGSSLDGSKIVPLGTSVLAESLAAGGSHTCAVVGDGQLKCWGYNFFGQLGLGDGSSRGAPGFGSKAMGDDLPFTEL